MTTKDNDIINIGSKLKEKKNDNNEIQSQIEQIMKDNIDNDDGDNDTVNNVLFHSSTSSSSENDIALEHKNGNNYKEGADVDSSTKNNSLVDKDSNSKQDGKKETKERKKRTTKSKRANILLNSGKIKNFIKSKKYRISKGVDVYTCAFLEKFIKLILEHCIYRTFVGSSVTEQDNFTISYSNLIDSLKSFTPLKNINVHLDLMNFPATGLMNLELQNLPVYDIQAYDKILLKKKKELTELKKEPSVFKSKNLNFYPVFERKYGINSIKKNPTTDIKSKQPTKNSTNNNNNNNLNKSKDNKDKDTNKEQNKKNQNLKNKIKDKDDKSKDNNSKPSSQSIISDDAKKSHEKINKPTSTTADTSSTSPNTSTKRKRDSAKESPRKKQKIVEQ